MKVILKIMLAASLFLGGHAQAQSWNNPPDSLGRGWTDVFIDRCPNAQCPAGQTLQHRYYVSGWACTMQGGVNLGWGAFGTFNPSLLKGLFGAFYSIGFVNASSLQVVSRPDVVNAGLCTSPMVGYVATYPSASWGGMYLGLAYGVSQGGNNVRLGQY